MNLRQQKGFSMTELMIAVAVLAIVMSIAAPSLSSYMDHRRIINVAESVYGQLQFARSEAIARSEMVYASFNSNDTTTWAMGISTRSGCDVTKTAETPNAVSNDCILIVDDGDADLDTGDGATDMGDLLYFGLDSSDFPKVSLGADGDSGTVGEILQIGFDPVRGTADEETIYLKFGNQYELHVVVFVTGRIRICSPAAATQVGGYSAC